jgi:hypothetical protein
MYSSIWTARLVRQKAKFSPDTAAGHRHSHSWVCLRKNYIKLNTRKEYYPFLPLAKTARKKKALNSSNRRDGREKFTHIPHFRRFIIHGYTNSPGRPNRRHIPHFPPFTIHGYTNWPVRPNRRHIPHFPPFTIHGYTNSPGRPNRRHIPHFPPFTIHGYTNSPGRPNRRHISLILI